ncbi:CAAX prenyl protease [Saccharomycopsis crataegensis]|uniref:intramembrane prenyl-peptidase Rce1 n=1 Tax=Saccharomycopsis crataegensis TaxID=43959 RepID=A0AAV5QTM3_9ASCO|nr:CAAX prenyl protease [Saccharomycopsis crataegensis]
METIEKNPRSPDMAIIACIVVATSYVAMLYTPYNRTTLFLRRNSPQLIKRRLVSAILLTLFWVSLTPIYLTFISKSASSIIQAVSLFGIIPGLKYTHDGYRFGISNLISYINDTSHCGLLIMVLLIGPIINEAFFETDFRGQRHSIVESVISELKTVMGLRNLVVAPITEEIIYRCVILSLLIPLNNVNADVLIFLTPLFFGVAHLHHGYELYKEGSIPVLQIIMVIGFQLLYTTLFGALEAFLFLRTGNALGICFVHACCNYFGFPSINIESDRKWWKYAYWMLLVVGVVGFKILLFPITESINSPIKWH